MSCRLLPALFLILTGCSRQSAPGVYRLLNTGPARVLVPPGVSDPTLQVRTFDFRPQQTVRATCRSSNDAVRVAPHRGSLRVTVERERLRAHPAPWLSDWTASLEQSGCLSAGEGSVLAERIAESIPLNPSDGFRLLHAGTMLSGYLDLAPDYQLKLISPILRDGALSGASALSTDTVSGSDTTLSVTVKASADFLGYEISWYALQPRPAGAGSRVVFAKAESHIGDQVTTAQQPRTNHFRFPEDAAYYRLFYLTRVSQADHNVALLSARSRAELDHQALAFSTDPDACAKVPTCVALPKEVAVTPYITVTAKGVPLAVPVEATVADALRAAGVSQPARVLPTLVVRRSYKGSPVRLEFDPSKPDILSLILAGREDLNW